MLRILLYAGVLLLLAGCATSSPADPSRDGPADAHAGESPISANTQLSIDAPATEPAAAVRLYTCPMHPSIIRDHPGKCPICGMTLEPKVGAK